MSLNDEEDDDRGAAALVIAPQKRADKDKDKVHRKKKYHNEKGEEEDTDIWVEKALPQVVASFDSAWLADLEGEAHCRSRPWICRVPCLFPKGCQCDW